MIANQLLGLANNGLEVIKDHQAAAAQEAALVAAIETPEQLAAAAALEQAKTRRTAYKVGAVVAAVTIATVGAVHEIDNGFNATRDGLNAIGGFFKGLLPKESADMQMNNLMHSLTFPAELPLETATGTTTPTIDTHNRLFGFEYSGSKTAVEENVSLALNIPNKFVSYKPVEVSVTNAAGETKKEWRLQATIITERDANLNENAHGPAHIVSTLEYKAAIDKIVDERASDGTIRRIGQVIVGSDADRRLKAATNLGMEGFASSCAPVLESVLPQAAAHAVQQEFASVLALKNMTGMPQTVKNAIDQMTSHAPVIVFENAKGSVMAPADVQIPVTPVDTQHYIASQLGVDAKKVTVANDETCAMDQNALRNLTTLMGAGN